MTRPAQPDWFIRLRVRAYFFRLLLANKFYPNRNA